MRSGRPIHLVTVRREYAAMILDGTKTAEVRLSRTRRVPLGLVEVGDRLYFKVVSGPVVATAIAESVRTLTDLTPAGVRSFGNLHASRLRAPASFFLERVEARYATLIGIGEVEPVEFGPSGVGALHGTVRDGWRVLEASADVYPECLRRELVHAG